MPFMSTSPVSTMIPKVDHLNRLPVEIIDVILDEMVATDKRAPLSPYSWYGQNWNIAVEDRTFQRIQVAGPDDFEMFERAFAGTGRGYRRRQAVGYILFAVLVPVDPSDIGIS